MCSQKKLEDELQHSLPECPAYDRIRIGITNFFKSSSPQTDNFIRLLSCEGKDTINALVRFLKLAYKIRNETSNKLQFFVSGLYCDGQITLIYCQSKVFLIQWQCSLNLFNVFDYDDWHGTVVL